MNTQSLPPGRFMVAVGAVVEYKNTDNILLIKRSSDQDWQPNEWEIVYGRVAQFETPQDGLSRELQEETGLTVKVKDFLTLWHIYRENMEDAEHELIGITFHCQSDTQKVILSHEHSDYKWVTPEKALKLVHVEGIRKDIIKFQQQAISA